MLVCDWPIFFVQNMINKINARAMGVNVILLVNKWLEINGVTYHIILLFAIFNAKL